MVLVGVASAAARGSRQTYGLTRNRWPGRPCEGEVVGCVGFESALLDPFSRTVHAAAAAEQMMAAEFDCMSQADVAHYAELHKAEVRVRVRVRVI